jgi:ubiquinone/menaquinone biosynthesis C-methylase UbiE
MDMHKDLQQRLERLTPIARVPITWDCTGYTSAGFNDEAASESFTGWDGDLGAEDECAVMVRLLDARRGDELLDVACGYGRHDLVFARKYGLAVTGVDVAPGLIARARGQAAREGLSICYQEAHARDLKYQAAFRHAMIAFNSFSLFSDRDAPVVLRALHRALKPEGRLFLDLDNKPHYCRYGSCCRNWFMSDGRLTLQDVFYHSETSVEVMRDITLNEAFDGYVEFTCFKRIYDREEITRLIETCGFAVEVVYGNWDSTPHNDLSPKIILVARKIGA